MEYNKLKIFVYSLVFLLSYGFSEAMVINNTLISSSNLNSTFVIGTQSWILDALTVDSDYIFVENLTHSNGIEASNEAITFNFSETNIDYLGIQVPYWLSSTFSRKKLYSGLAGDLPVTVHLDVKDCFLINLRYKPNGGVWEEYNVSNLTCTNNVLSMDLYPVSTGINEIVLIYSEVFLDGCVNNTDYSILLGIYHENNITPIDFSRLKGTIYYWDSINYDTDKSIGQQNYSFEEIVITSPALTGEKDVLDTWEASSTAGAGEIETEFTVKKDAIISSVYNRGLLEPCNDINVSIYEGECTTGVLLAQTMATPINGSKDFTANFTINDYLNATPLHPLQTYCILQDKQGSCYPQRSAGTKTASSSILDVSSSGIGNYNYFSIRALGYIQSGAEICISPLDANITADAIIQYTGGTEGFTKWWYFYNQTLTNTTISMYMYNFNETTTASQLQVTTRHINDYTFFKDLYVNLFRFYPAENLWRNVQKDKSDNKGNSIFHILEDSELYRIEFRDEKDRLIRLTEGMRFICSSGLCEVTYLLSEYAYPSATGNLTVNYHYSDTTKMLNINWSDSSSSTEYVKLNVRKETMASTTDICSTTYYTPSGSASCNLTSYTNEVFIYIEADDTVKVSEWVDLTKTGIGSVLSFPEQAIWTFLIMLAVIGFGLISPAVAVISGIIGLLAVFFLGIFTPVTITFVTIAVIIGVIIAMKVKR